MLRILGPAALALPLLVLPAPSPGQGVPAPVHAISVEGTGVGMYPAFRASVDRYAVTTDESTGGSMTVTASTSDPSGKVLINGRRDADGVATLTGLTGGDEVSIIIVDSAGTEVHSLVYLPTYFPELTTVVDEPGNSAGDVLLTLFNVRSGTGPRPGFDTAVDRNGVPRWLWATPAGQSSLDLKPAGFGGHYTVSRSTATSAGRQGSALVELDEQFRPVRSFETVGLVNTDGHDSILRADGSRILVAYERDWVTNRIDAVIQEVDPQGSVVHTWNSADHMDPATETTSVSTADDYAHINSIRVMADGDILASFRNLSAVLKIAWSDHDGFQRGDIVWRLGGRHSDFEFVDDPYPGGPCAQHTASELPNGNILIYDNGSVNLGGADQSNCVDPTNPEGATINRAQTRVTEYALDADAGTATLEWQHLESGRFAYFAGSATRMSNGHTMIGWAAAQQAVASEVDATGAKVWEIKTDDGYITYRAVKAHVPDAIRPVVAITSPADGGTYVKGAVVPAELECTDVGGSSLQTCDGPQVLDTSTTGEHTWTVTATDGAGNTTTVERSYTVVAPAYRPDAMIKGPGASWTGNNVYGGYLKQRISQTLAKTGAVRTAVVRLQSEANRAERLRVSGTAGGERFRVRYYAGGHEVTGKVVAGTWSTPALAPGRYVDLKVTVTRRGAARPGDSRIVKVLATSAHDASRRDAVATVVRATR